MKRGGPVGFLLLYPLPLAPRGGGGEREEGEGKVDLRISPLSLPFPLPIQPCPFAPAAGPVEQGRGTTPRRHSRLLSPPSAPCLSPAPLPSRQCPCPMAHRSCIHTLHQVPPLGVPPCAALDLISCPRHFPHQPHLCACWIDGDGGGRSGNWSRVLTGCHAPYLDKAASSQPAQRKHGLSPPQLCHSAAQTPYQRPCPVPFQVCSWRLVRRMPLQISPSSPNAALEICIKLHASF